MLDEHIMKKIAAQEKLGGIDISKLPIGSWVIAKTNNTIYKIKILENNEVLVKGGKYFPEKTICVFNGSTWGGSMLKINWIGHNMHMEFVTKNNLITTTAVTEAKIVTKEWHYNMEWTKIDPK